MGDIPAQFQKTKDRTTNQAKKYILLSGRYTHQSKSEELKHVKISEEDYKKLERGISGNENFRV